MFPAWLLIARYHTTNFCKLCELSKTAFISCSVNSAVCLKSDLQTLLSGLQDANIYIIMEKQPLIKQAWLRVLIFTITFLVINLLVAYITGSIRKRKVTDSSDMLQGDALAYLLISAVIAFITVFFFRRIVDKKSLTSLGLKWNHNQAYAGTGFFLGLLLLGLGSLVLIANNNLHWTDIDFDANQLFLGLGLMIIIAFAEELVVRGYILNNLLQSTNKWIALTISALIFSLFHANNNGINPISLVNIFLAGMMLGINYIYTGNLWFGILFHFIWNFYQSAILGYKVSGVRLKSLLEQDLTGNNWLTGGNFGFEGSILTTVLLCLSLASLAWVYEKKFAIHSWRGKENVEPG